MKESRYYNLLLMLILLVISCNLKSKEGAAGGASVSGVTVDKDLSRAKRDDKQESIDVKFDQLLDTFKLQGEEVELVKYIRSAVTDSDVGTSGDKTYTDLEFYNLLVNLGDARLKEIIAVYLGPFKAQKGTQLAIENLNEATLKRELQEFQDWLKAEEDFYLSELRRVFNETALDSVHDRAINSNYLVHFPKLKANAERVMEFERLYASFSADEQKGIDYIRDVATNPDIGHPTYNITYNHIEFDLAFLQLRDELQDVKLREMIQVHSKRLKEEMPAALNVIERINADPVIVRLELDDDFCDIEDKYQQHVKHLFCNSQLNFDQRYAGFVDNNAFNFIKLKADAEGVLKGKVVYEALIDYYEVIEDMQRVVMNPDIGRAEGYKTYTNTEFYILLGNLGKDKVKEIMDAHSETLQMIYKALEAIKGVKDAREKKDLSEKLGNFSDRDSLAIKKIFNESTPDAVYNSGIIKSIYTDHFVNIKNEADAKSNP
ncbi:BTA121 domain-containing protein surface lipoprotein [Borrelia hermsii]|uniref:Uncharacterized protein n=2 Tax=Borrelia hermsii TaxID=140 RepID=T1ECG3_BORHE|nr:hypothetical protein [Borrelia hermsii]ADN26411.2 hypothetical protein BHA149 [Borrelia hermsii]AMR75987.1 hypothetical protein A0V01_05075 [Borrelia hermsii]ANA43791.1 Mrl-type protein [Borrelia hermsii HS1]